MAQSRAAKELLVAWTGWHAIRKPMRSDFTRFVALSNAGARAAGLQGYRRDLALEIRHDAR